MERLDCRVDILKELVNQNGGSLLLDVGVAVRHLASRLLELREGVVKF